MAPHSPSPPPQLPPIDFMNTRERKRSHSLTNNELHPTPPLRTSSLPLDRPSPSPSSQPWRSRDAWLALHQRPSTGQSHPTQLTAGSGWRSNSASATHGTSGFFFGSENLEVRRRRIQDEWDENAHDHVVVVKAGDDDGHSFSSVSNKISHEDDRENQPRSPRSVATTLMTIKKSLMTPDEPECLTPTSLLPPLLPSKTIPARAPLSPASSFTQSRGSTPIPWSQSRGSPLPSSSRRPSATTLASNPRSNSSQGPNPATSRPSLPKSDSVATSISTLSSSSSFGHLTPSHSTSTVSTRIMTPSTSHRRRRSSLPTVNVSPSPIIHVQSPRKMSAPSPFSPTSPVTPETPDLTPTPTPVASTFHSATKYAGSQSLAVPAIIRPGGRPGRPTRPLPAVPVDAVSIVDSDDDDDDLLSSSHDHFAKPSPNPSTGRATLSPRTPPPHRDGYNYGYLHQPSMPSLRNTRPHTPPRPMVDAWLASIEALREPQPPVVGKYHAVEWTVSSKQPLEESSGKRPGRTLRKSSRHVERGGWI